METKYFILWHDLQKKKVAIWNSRINELAEFSYEDDETNELAKFSNFQIVSDSEYVYFIGG